VVSLSSEIVASDSQHFYKTMKPWSMLLLPFEETPPLVVQEISLELIHPLETALSTPPMI
jgi:hypothetical protein